MFNIFRVAAPLQIARSIVCLIAVFVVNGFSDPINKRRCYKSMNNLGFGDAIFGKANSEISFRVRSGAKNPLLDFAKSVVSISHHSAKAFHSASRTYCVAPFISKDRLPNLGFHAEGGY